MPPEEFYRMLGGLIHQMKPQLDITGLQPDTHLWSTGFVDSVSMLEIVEFIEDSTGREIELDGDFLENFLTMRTIYDSYVHATSTAAPGAN